jgi:hypothetical protein
MNGALSTYFQVPAFIISITLKGEVSILMVNTKRKERINAYSDDNHKPHDVTSGYSIHQAENIILSSSPEDVMTGTVTLQVLIFSGSGLGAIAGTQHSGSVGVPILYDYLASGKNIGEAWKDSIRWSIEHSGEQMEVYWCDRKEFWTEGKDPYKAVLIGDGTLHLPAGENHSGKNNR